MRSLNENGRREPGDVVTGSHPKHPEVGEFIGRVIVAWADDACHVRLDNGIDLFFLQHETRWLETVEEVDAPCHKTSSRSSLVEAR